MAYDLPAHGAELRCPPYIIFATANLGYAIVVEAALSFLGVGTPPDVPSWGGMLSISGQKYAGSFNSRVVRGG